MQHFFTIEDSKKTWEFVKGKGLFPFHKTMIEQCEILAKSILIDVLWKAITHVLYML